MRLLNTKNCQLKTFIGNSTPEYAILSHTWARDSEQEISFDDIQKPHHEWGKKGAFSKFDGFREITTEDGHEWIWIDTCCIDKSSSAELSEAINSMFQWYKRAYACYVYLEDVDSNSESWQEEFISSRWFTRGWTLQELLAPKVVQFYDKNWIELGTRNSLQSTITVVTGISEEILIRPDNMSNRTVAERMSWVAKRESTRVEDIAYCLLGIFDVNMPLLYGEGVKSFRRLQEEILKSTEDYTLLAWTEIQPNSKIALATSPSSFCNPPDGRCQYWSFYDESSNQKKLQNLNPPKSTPLWNYSQLRLVNSQKLSHLESHVRSIIIKAKKSGLDEFPIITPKGLRLTLPIIKGRSDDEFLAFLHSTLEPGGELACLALTNYGDSNNMYERAWVGLAFLAGQKISVEIRTIYLRITVPEENPFQRIREAIRSRFQQNSIALCIGTRNSSLLLFHNTALNPDITHHLLLEYKPITFHLFFGVTVSGVWCYLFTEEDSSMPRWPAGPENLQTAFIEKYVVGRRTDRAKMRIKGQSIFCAAQKRLPNWLHLQEKRLTKDDFKRAGIAQSLYSVDVWADGGAIEVISKERIQR